MIRIVKFYQVGLHQIKGNCSWDSGWSLQYDQRLRKDSMQVERDAKATDRLYEIPRNEKEARLVCSRTVLQMWSQVGSHSQRGGWLRLFPRSEYCACGKCYHGRNADEYMKKRSNDGRSKRKAEEGRVGMGDIS